MTPDIDSIDALEHDDAARLLVDMFQRLVIHHALWFTEIRHQMGMQKALEAFQNASSQSLAIQLKRLGKALGFEMRNGLPAPLMDLSTKELIGLIDATAVNWLANDGIWFQAVEFANGMNDAKRCNDSCWAHFAPFEAWSIKRFLGLPNEAGLEGLKKALNFRLYARINTQSIVPEGPDSFVFQMNECRVQSARKRKGLPDYPCHSAGNVEYPYFARAIDARIATACIACPPDDHPDDWYCAWRFTIANGS